jgi:hypothetical protein
MKRERKCRDMVIFVSNDCSFSNVLVRPMISCRVIVNKDVLTKLAGDVQISTMYKVIDLGLLRLELLLDNPEVVDALGA